MGVSWVHVFSTASVLVQQKYDLSVRLMSRILTIDQTAQPQIIADVLFLHERGLWNTLYFAFYFGAIMVTYPHSSFISMRA